ncbi:MAG: mucoidy inhibitor MuiA family protein [Pseudonocardiales bacterium]
MTYALQAPIVAVTVYPGQARITRTGRITVAPGRERVVLGGLPLGLRADSVRVSGRGAATVLGVDVVADRHPSSPEPVIRELEERQRALQARLDELVDADSVQSTRAELLNRLAHRSGAAFARALAVGTADPSRVTTVGVAVGDQLTAVLAQRRALAEQRRVVQEEHDEVTRALYSRVEQQAPDRTAIAAELQVTGDSDPEVELDVSYVVDNARWASRYDVRLIDDRLMLTWFGLVTQSTGEDWPECDLRLSTARQAGAVTVPELEPWFLDIRRPQPVVPQYDAAQPGGPIRHRPAPMAAAALPMENAVASVEHGVAAATYRPGQAVAVPSDGTAHRTTLTVVELPARLDHVAVPVRGPEVYLRATVTNTSEHALRPGPAAIFHGNQFAGTTMLDPWAPGEEVVLALGIDDRVRVERELVRRSAGKAVIGGTRRQEAEYTIEVANFAAAVVRLTVIDQLPVSRNEAIVVRDVRLNPQPAEVSDLGEVTWRLELAPAAKASITMGFRVDIGKGADVAGWRE